MTWAKGEWKDEWNNTFVLAKNNDSVQFVSKGPDRILDTNDDMSYEYFKQCIKILNDLKTNPEYQNQLNDYLKY